MCSIAVVTAAGLVAVDQDYLLQARQMQALSFAVHIPLVCFGIAFPAMILFVEWRYLRTGDELYRTLARRWTRVMVALFAVGVITGTILSFEMGLLWPAFTATFGGVFGLGFAIEGFSFFLEAIFAGIYVYGWTRLSSKMHFASGIPMAIAGFTGSLTVMAVNGWMNHPTGFALRDGKVVDVRPFEALFENSYFWHELIHMYLAGYMVTGFVLAGCYAVGRSRGRWGRYERTALAIPLTIAALASPAQIVIGDWAARAVAESQPIKLAALEGLGQTTSGAPEHLLGWYSAGEVHFGVAIPRLLSLLAYHDPSATVLGLNAFPADGPLSVVALLSGWVTTEVGRQPWVVYRVMRTNEAVTGAAGIPVGYATLAAVYGGVVVAVVWILRRLASAPLPLLEPPAPATSPER
jgi:cytochrome d ubiquinol oxidase subunit I